MNGTTLNATTTMEQEATLKHAGEQNPFNTTSLFPLSLISGGVRGLSSVYMVRGIMDRVARARQQIKLAPMKPYKVFDLIGCTCTGG